MLTLRLDAEPDCLLSGGVLTSSRVAPQISPERRSSFRSIGDSQATSTLTPKPINPHSVNYEDQEKYTPLTVLSSRPDVRREHILRVLKLGADKFHQVRGGTLTCG